MMNLLNNNKKPEDKETSAPEPVKERVDISKYQDPEGLNITELEVGLWFLKHRLFFLYVFYGLLIIIALLTWPFFVWHYGQYVFVGMKEDAAMFNGVKANSANLLSAMQAQRPKGLEWQNPQALRAAAGQTSFIAKAYNPNPAHLARFSYSFSYGGAETEVWSSFLYPGESRYITAVGADSGPGGRLPSLNIVSTGWKRISGHEYPDWTDFFRSHFDVVISQEKFTPGSQSLVSNKESISQVSFSAENASAYSYKNIDFTIILKQGQSIVGAERWGAENFVSGEKYDYNLSLIGAYNNVNSLEIIPEIDIINTDNYLYIGSGPAEPK